MEAESDSKQLQDVNQFSMKRQFIHFPVHIIKSQNNFKFLNPSEMVIDQSQQENANIQTQFACMKIQYFKLQQSRNKYKRKNKKKKILLEKAQRSLQWVVNQRQQLRIKIEQYQGEMAANKMQNSVVAAQMRMTAQLNNDLMNKVKEQTQQLKVLQQYVERIKKDKQMMRQLEIANDTQKQIYQELKIYNNQFRQKIEVDRKLEQKLKLKSPIIELNKKQVEAKQKCEHSKQIINKQEIQMERFNIKITQSKIIEEDINQKQDIQKLKEEHKKQRKLIKQHYQKQKQIWTTEMRQLKRINCNIEVEKDLLTQKISEMQLQLDNYQYGDDQIDNQKDNELKNNAALILHLQNELRRLKIDSLPEEEKFKIAHNEIAELRQYFMKRKRNRHRGNKQNL